MFIAFSTATPDLVDGRQRWSTLENEEIDPLLAATGRRDGANAGSGPNQRLQ
jgi:hypothetical protein